MSDGQHDTGATVRAWTDVIRRCQFDGIITGTHQGRHVKSSTVKAVALMLASYADANGRRVFPGVARLAVDCEIGYNVAGRCVVGLRQLGLIELVRRAVRRGARSERERTDEYRLTLPVDLLDRLTVPTPSDYRVIVARIAKPHRRRVSPPSKTGSDRPAPHPPYAGSETASDGESNHASDTTFDESNRVSGRNLTPSQLVSTYTQDLDTTDTSHSENALPTNLALPRARDAEAEDPNFGEGDAEREGGPPRLHVVTGGGHTTPTLPGLWPAPVPNLDPPPIASPATAQQAINAMRRTLADRKRARRTA